MHYYEHQLAQVEAMQSIARIKNKYIFMIMKNNTVLDMSGFTVDKPKTVDPLKHKLSQ